MTEEKTKKWECAAQKQNTAHNDPAECDWPVCGCDSHADKVIADLQERGALKDIDEANGAQEDVVAWRVKDYADGWVLFDNMERAIKEAKHTGAKIEPLLRHPCPEPHSHCANAAEDKQTATAKIILKMIEEVDPADTAKLDEIDTRINFYASSQEFPKCDIKRAVRLEIKYGNWKEYTRSRDALKAIKPKGWSFHVDATCLNYPEVEYVYCHDKIDIEMKSGFLKTEELAELHPIIQAIEYERKLNPDI